MKRLLSFILVLLALAASGKTRDQVPVDASGAITQRTGTQTDTPFLYNGAYGVVTDPNGLLQMQARYYNPNIRRFINADPSGFSGGMNFYAFAGGDPVSLIDPSGLGASPIDGSEDYDPMMEGDRVKATLANLLSFGMAEEASISFARHGLLDDREVSTAELWMTRIGFAANFIPVERVAKLASGLAGRLGEMATTQTGVLSRMVGRLEGQIVEKAFLDRLEPILKKQNVNLYRNSDVILDTFGKNTGAGFIGYPDGYGELYVRANATKYEVFHELKHFADFNRLKPEAYLLRTKDQHEMSVYRYMQKQNWLTPMEKKSAKFQIE